MIRRLGQGEQKRYELALCIIERFTAFNASYAHADQLIHAALGMKGCSVSWHYAS
jgi:hypothetical protein